MTWKSVRDRYKRLESVYAKADKRSKKSSSLGGEVSQLEDLLSLMREAKNDVIKERLSDKLAQAALEVEKEEAGFDLVTAATKRKRKTESENSCAISLSKRAHVSPVKSDGDIESFGKYLHDADMARVELEREKLNFERERFAAEREDRKLERESNAKLELEKMKVLVNALTKKE